MLWPLKSTRQKRNFNQSPEPAGDEKVRRNRAKKATGRFFCVQKHLASHLHYDLRLEHDGVLLSWAVPKGPSLDPEATSAWPCTSRIIPSSTATFEGVIPSGYGAGIVMLWDRGTWTPEIDDVGAALKKGDLKFTLDGYKLKGSWVLVRTGGRFAGGDGRSLAAHQAPRRLGGRARHRRVRAAEREERRRLRGHPVGRQPGRLASNRPAKGGETGEDVGVDHRGAPPSIESGAARRPASRAPKRARKYGQIQADAKACA